MVTWLGIGKIVAQFAPQLHDNLRRKPPQWYVGDMTLQHEEGKQHPTSVSFASEARDINDEAMPTLNMLLSSDMQWSLEPDTLWIGDIALGGFDDLDVYTLVLSPEKGEVTLFMGIGASGYTFPINSEDLSLIISRIYSNKDGYPDEWEWWEDVTDIAYDVMRLVVQSVSDKWK